MTYNEKEAYGKGPLGLLRTPFFTGSISAFIKSESRRLESPTSTASEIELTLDDFLQASVSKKG